MKMIFYSGANKTHFYKIGSTRTFCKLVYKVNVFGIWIWPTCSAKAVWKKKIQIGIRQCTVADIQLTQLHCTLNALVSKVPSWESNYRVCSSIGSIDLPDAEAWFSWHTCTVHSTVHDCWVSEASISREVRGHAACSPWEDFKIGFSGMQFPAFPWRELVNWEGLLKKMLFIRVSMYLARKY